MPAAGQYHRQRPKGARCQAGARLSAGCSLTAAAARQQQQQEEQERRAAAAPLTGSQMASVT